jgi:hypothetical protein
VSAFSPPRRLAVARSRISGCCIAVNKSGPGA